MKLINRIIIGLILFLFNINFAQEFNGYKYIIVRDLNYGVNGNDIYNLSRNSRDYFKSKGLNVINENNIPDDLKNNICLGLILEVNNDFNSGFANNLTYGVSMDFRDCMQNSIKKIRNTSSNELASSQKNYDKSLKRCFNDLDKILDNYFYDSKLTPKIEYPEVENINKTEADLKADFDSKQIDPIEGIYKTYKSEINYKVGIFKVGELYKAIIIESDISHWKKGDVKAIFESTAAEGVFSTKYYMGNKTSIETFANLEGGLINIEIKNQNGENNDVKFLKLYPKN
jgi:hypothetical protein